ncbi:Translin [Westerdykella ornata]|uniref:Translin n=1 Tax=Westerdykella ornata TaxID=318751 RepID=A0A6A6JJ81_WESOR|nr:Translin [Westerdykella ornata]KAF2276314.1 Translin [Westerdykella ornata]
MAAPSGLIAHGLFEDLQARTDEDTAIRDGLRDIIQTWEKQNRSITYVLSRGHGTPIAKLSELLKSAEEPLGKAVETVGKLAEVASKAPYYKFNGMWSRQMQDLVFQILFWGWLGGYENGGGEVKSGRLMNIEEVGEYLKVPVNLKDEDKFHLAIEEYLHALISLVEELARLARNSVTMGEYERPVLINQFVKDVLAGFQILNLKNDSLRRRSDSLKYKVKDVEDIIYDLSLRDLLPKKE